MCGLIAAIAAARGLFTPQQLGPGLQQMAQRGPDAERTWHDDLAALGHRRLSILDLDPRSHQPMLSASGRHAIVFNGEIYNFADLRKELIAQGASFRTTSDTEVLLALFEREGERMLSRLRGMFAFVIWDTVTKKAFCARDPYGIKPLYYAQLPQGVLLASQVKALLATGLVGREPDPKGQAGFWLLGSVPEPHTWYRTIRALPAGHAAWIVDGRIQPSFSHWDIGQSWRTAPTKPLPEPEVRERTRKALRDSIAAHLVSDVPVGVFLSGGIDSGALAGLMKDAGAKDLQGVTIGFREFAGQHHDEAPVAAAIAKHYGIRHHVRMVTREEFEADLPRILRCMDQPSIDGINTWYASKAVAECGLKVIVSGVGGDELFHGYSNMRRIPRSVPWLRALRATPLANTLARAVLRRRAARTGNPKWAHALDWGASIPGAVWLGRTLHVPEQLSELMPPEAAAAVLADFSPERWVGEMCGSLAADPRVAMSQVESMTYMRNQLLRDSDWASMDHSVELRTPLVDAWLLRELEPVLASLPNFPKKCLLAEAPQSPLPQEILDRRKTGFGIPLGAWLKKSTLQARAESGRESRAWSKIAAMESPKS